MMTQLISGLGGAIGCRFLPTRNQLVFVEYSGKISAVDLIRPLVATVSQGTTVLKGTWTFDCETGALGAGSAGDIWWEQMTATARQMRPISGATIVNLGQVSYESVTPATLQTLKYGTTPIPGNNDSTNQLTDGTVFAVFTNAANYAKVQVLSYGYNMTVRWTTYQVGPRYCVLGAGYAEPEDIAVAANETTAYVTERKGNLLRVHLGTANRANATVVASGLSAPHQLWLDEPNGHAYLVEFGSPGRLVRVTLASGDIKVIASGLEGAIGLLITSDRATAYVSEQAATGGRIVRISLGTGSRQQVATGLTEPFMLSWADPSETRILVTERGAARKLKVVDVTGPTAAVTEVRSGLPDKPSSCAVVAPGKVLICSDREINLIELPWLIIQPTTNLLMGIGKVPFDRIIDGLADTSGDPSYPYQFKGAPFGGTLPVLVNHQRAYLGGARYYAVLVDGARRFDSFVDYRWNAIFGRYEARTVSTERLATGAGFYPVRSPAELFLWLNPALGTRLDTVGLSDGLRKLRVVFYTASGAELMRSEELTIRVNNQRCTATLGAPTVGDSAADTECGTLKYPPTKDGTVRLPLTASHPAGFATYSFSLIKGVRQLTPPSVSGSVSDAPSRIDAPVATLLGACNIAAFAATLRVATTVIDGEVRQSQYDARDSIAFALAPAQRSSTLSTTPLIAGTKPSR